ncbi:hypothetical protein B0H14DRAFT_2563393 [Mycena olivaceomarginata]|nr:hypothetical protein B0H14DRAFT_2563393 [Mycena olivaceomarginata]
MATGIASETGQYHNDVTLPLFTHNHRNATSVRKYNQGTPTKRKALLFYKNRPGENEIGSVGRTMDERVTVSESGEEVEEESRRRRRGVGGQGRGKQGKGGRSKVEGEDTVEGKKKAEEADDNKGRRGEKELERGRCGRESESRRTGQGAAAEGGGGSGGGEEEGGGGRGGGERRNEKEGWPRASIVARPAKLWTIAEAQQEHLRYRSVDEEEHNTQAPPLNVCASRASPARDTSWTLQVKPWEGLGDLGDHAASEAVML